MSYRYLWIALASVVVLSFAVLGGVGAQMITSAPAVGAVVLGYFVLGLATGWSFDDRGVVGEGEATIRPVSALGHAGD